ncbi:hypothetical protein D3C78_1646940 [compost metagenome]
MAKDGEFHLAFDLVDQLVVLVEALCVQMLRRLQACQAVQGVVLVAAQYLHR